MKYLCRPTQYRCHAALYEHGTEYYLALAGDMKLICSEGILTPCTRVYHASVSGQILSYRPIIKMMGTIDIALAITILEENILIVDTERQKAAIMVKKILHSLKEFQDEELYDLLKTTASLHYELARRSLELHSKTLEC